MSYSLKLFWCLSLISIDIIYYTIGYNNGSAFVDWDYSVKYGNFPAFSVENFNEPNNLPWYWDY